MCGIDLQFLPTAGIAARSQRELELARSVATAHAARVCHARRKSSEQFPMAETIQHAASTSLDLTLDESQNMSENADTCTILVGNDATDKDAIYESAQPDTNVVVHKLQHSAPTATTRKRRRTPSTSPRSVHDLLTPSTREAPGGAFDVNLRQSIYDFSFSASLSAHKLNDYVTISERLSDPYTAKLLHYSVTTFWPGFDPGPGSSLLHTPPFIRSWVRLFVEEPALFHTAIWAAALHNSVQTQKSIYEHEAIEHHHLALQNISREVAKPIESISEATILAVLGVATRELIISNKPQLICQGFRPPFHDLQWLHVYGRRPYIPIHERIWIHLVEMKGGLNCITLPSFAALMQYTDVIGSTLRLRQPRFPVCNLFEQIQKDQTRQNLFGHMEGIGDASANITPSMHLLIKHGLANEMLQVMLDLRVWTKLLKKYSDNAVEQPDYSQLAIHRNLIQHRLLCTVPYDEDLDQESATECAIVFNNCGAHLPDITKIVRLCLLLFSIGVTFPITYDRPFRVLVERLEKQILAEFSTLYSVGLNNFLIWTCVLGGVGAAQLSDEVLKSRFVDCLAQIEQANAVQRATALLEPGFVKDPHGDGTIHAKSVARTWNEVKQSCLHPFVWHDGACDFGAQLIWEEVKWRVERSD